MAQTKTSRKKPKLSRRGLKDNGVYYECKVLQSDAWLPDQATTARDALLNFEHRVPLVKRRELEEDLRSVEDEGLDLWDGTYSPLPTAEEYYWRLKSMAGRSDLGVQEEMVETVALGRKDADDFRALQNDNEAGWTHALIANIFKRPDRIAWGEQARFGQVYKHWRLEENVLWSAQPNVEVCSNDEHQPLSKPKPDLTYGFPILNTAGDLTRFHQRATWLRFLSPDFMQRLSAQGLKCTLTNHLLHAKPGSSVQLLKHQLMAFPWAIVEVKPEDVPDARETFCFNQAANATAAAIRMYKRLTDACPGSEGRDIPAVIAFTCVGPRVKVWLAYFDDRTFATRMVCIWSANLTSAWGVLSIRMIVSNMHEWASIPLSMNLNTLLQVIEWNLPKGRRPTDEDCLSINDPADHNHTPDTGSILAEQGSTASQADDESSQGHDADDCSLPGSIPYTPKVSTELCASDPATDSPYSDRGDSRRTLHRATSSAGRASTWQETTPGHDSGIESDMPTSPAQEVSARGLRYQLKTGMDVRNLTTALTTPTKIMLPHKVLRRSSCSSTVGQPVLTDEGISKAPATLLDTEGPLPDAENHAEPSPSDMLSDDPISNSEMPLQGTNDSKEWTSAQPRAPSRPRAPRTRTGRTGHLYEQAWASAKELSERLTGSSSTGELGLPQMCAEEWYRQSQTGDGAYFNPAISASPMQSPGPSRVAEQDDSNSLRPSVSSRRSLFGRRTSSRASQPDAACMSPSKPPTDASSERSVASSRFELVDRSARHGLDVAKERYHNFDVKGAAREVGLGGVVDGYEKGRALMQARKGRGQGAVVRDEGSDEMQNVGLGGDQKTSNAEDDGHVCGGASAERSEAAEVDSVNTDGMSDQAAAMPGGWAV